MARVIFSAALFISALLLFSVQPLVAKILLPYLGGTPAVWNTCMVFFQVMLLGGYIYAHILPKIGVRRHMILHLALMLAAVTFLPIGVSAKAVASLPSVSSAPVWLLLTLLTTIGVPFFILSTNAPLLQHWFASTSHPRAQDPYFLYAASNLGSLLALLTYPVVLEPNLTLRHQSLVWAGAYVLEVALIVICALMFMLGNRTSTADVTDHVNEDYKEASSYISWSRRLRWLVFAFVPSSLMLGVTTYISIDLVPIPLLWVIPLSLYLLTFIIQFSRGRANVDTSGRFLLPLLSLPVVVSLASPATQGLWFLVPMHLGFFFSACMVCHGQLANDRPSSRHLTEFYLWLSVGGALGGLFTALLAPLLFPGVIEYPLMVVLACLLRPWKENLGKWDFILPLVILILLCGILFTLQRMETQRNFFLIPFTFFVLAAYSQAERPIRFGLAMLSVLVAATLYSPDVVRVLHSERNFFGVLRVLSNEPDTIRSLLHGTTIHGTQFTDSARRCEPLSYYHRAGPFGSIAGALSERTTPHIAVVGLGAGATACYATTGQEWTYYEIDPAVVRIARDSSLFSYVDGCSKAPISYILGDGRLRLKEAPDRQYFLIALDAFSSDAIPLHLLTREAVGLYLSKLSDGGLIAFHVTNRYFDLTPPLGSVAKTYNLSGLVMQDVNVSAEDARDGKYPSVWVVLARRPEDLKRLTSDTRWHSLVAPENFRGWTDDFSNIFSVFKP